MDLLRIALLQIAPCGSLEGNLKKGVEYCKKAKEMGAHIALLPEMWSCGYDICRRPFEEWKKEGVPADSSFVRTFGGGWPESFPWQSALPSLKSVGRDVETHWFYVTGRGKEYLPMQKCIPVSSGKRRT
mgnify:CR=1 FL=1